MGRPRESIHTAIGDCEGLTGDGGRNEYDRACRRRMKSPELTNPFFTDAKASGESSRPGSLRVQQGIGDGLALSRIPYRNPVSVTIEGWDGFYGGRSVVRFACGRR